ncbi:hypothetical protein B0H21DRAFT_244986 [Amylocystis lapponica]|nr:hypothetical protein B0H21DRAFT_244986 [Amylocystis lapponica]
MDSLNPSLPLIGPRGRCVFNGSPCPQTCASFVVQDPDGSLRLEAIDALELCGSCGHYWLSHSAGPTFPLVIFPPRHPNHALVKGGVDGTSCGGFYSPSSSWSLSSVCVCMKSWPEHIPFPSTRTAIPGPSVQAPFSMSTVIPVSSRPPIQPYLGLHSVATGTVQDRRMDSAQRKLPQHQHGATSRPRRGQIRTTATSHTPPSQTRRSGPPHPFPMSSFADTLAPSGTATSLVQPPTRTTFSVGLLPYVVCFFDVLRTLIVVNLLCHHIAPLIRPL